MMYTVFRFTSDSLSSDVFERLGKTLNKVVPGAFTGLRPKGDGFACELTDSDQWGSHRAAILDFIHQAGPMIVGAVREGVDVCVDVAIEPDDMKNKFYLSILVDPTLAEGLANSGVNLVLSFYGTGNA